MSFVSPEFAFVALLFYPLYWLLKPYREAQMMLLLFSSYLLYATWSVEFAVILFLFSSYIWLAGWWLSGLQPGKRRVFCCACGLAMSLMVLVVTKYYSFSREMLVALFPSLGQSGVLPIVDIVAPAGISFFTFQAITYLMWEYEEHVGRLRFTHLLLFLSFWPTLFAGPILRAKDFFRQLQGDEIGAPKEVERAAYYLILGLTQKLVLANWLAMTFVDEGFRYPDSQSTVATAAIIVAYSLQIFFDFAGYTLIVTALALLLGFSLPVNFRQPYLAANLGEFWRRWHVSLSFFIRDYVYIPLGGNRHGFFRAQLNILIAMVISGLWHGANTTFVVWGWMHGLGVVGVNIVHRYSRLSIPTGIANAITLLYVGVAWVFFRADSWETAISLLRNLGLGSGDMTVSHACLCVLAVTYLAAAHYAAEIEEAVVAFLRSLSPVALASLATVALYLIILFGPSGVPGFIYYQF